MHTISNFTGIDTFTFNVSDRNVDSNESTVTITVNAVSTGGTSTENTDRSSSGGGAIGMFWILLISLLIIKNDSWRTKSNLLMLKVSRG